MASETARKKYPSQIVVMTTAENRERFVREAEDEGVSIAEVVRGYLEAGIDALDERNAEDARNLAHEALAEPRTDEALESSRRALL